MRLELRGRHVDLTPALRELIDIKLAKLERYLSERAISTQVILTREKERHRVDITLHARGEKFLHGVGDAVIWETSLGEAVEKIIQQAQKIKGKFEARKRQAPKSVRTALVGGNGASAPAAAKPAARKTRARVPRTLKASRQAIKPMSVADAAREAETGDGLVIFRDPATQAINVVYRRQDGQLTLVETEA
jgi:ribosome hibernation promoting factor